MLTIKQLKDRIYQDFITSFNNAITPLKKSLFEQFANTLAATFNLAYIYLTNIFNDSFLTTCTDSRVLNYFAPLKNVSRKEPTQSVGTIRFTGSETTIIPIGTIVTYNELEYQTTEEGTISAGFSDVIGESVFSGTENNTLDNIDMFLSVPISGIDNKATSILGFLGATDLETIESLRTRTKIKFGTTTQVDNDNYYKSLANEVDNVKASFVSDLKNGLGTFGVTILTIGNDGVPIQSDIDEVENYFISKNAVPTYAQCEYFLPSITNINFGIQLAINDLETQLITEQLIRDYIYLVQKPNTDFVYQNLSTYLQDNGARLITPLPSTITTLNDDEVIDVGVITWI